MSVKIISRKIESHTVVIRMADGSNIKGKINVHSDEHMIQRVSDIFTKIQDPFIVVFDAVVEGKGGQVVVVNKRNIIWVSPED